jgi:hypothetical protein
MKHEKGLLAWAANEKQETIAKIDHIMAVVDAEVAEYGYYPHNGKSMTKIHVLTRAKVSPSTLKNPTHVKTRQDFNKWYKNLRKKLNAPRSGTVDFDKVNSMRDAINAIASELHIMKLEHNEARLRIAELQAANAELTSRNNEMSTELAALRAAAANVYRIRK